MTEPVDEFSFLPAQASDWGIPGPVPRGERLSIALPDGRTLSALRYGDGPPVVTFVHGAGLNAHTWDSTILALGLPALAVDLPGHGDSSWRPDAAYVAATLAPDVVAGVEAWTDRPQLLVGQSLGGLTAAAVAASRPDLVRELVVVDITPGIASTGGPAQLREFFSGPADWASRDELVDRALAFGLGGSRAAAERGVFHNSRVRPDGRVEWKHHFARLANELSRSPEAAAAAAAGQDALGAVLSESGWHDLEGVQAPVTLVRGDHGYVTDEDAAEFARRLPAASVEVVVSGHNVQEELPVDLGRRLRARADGA
ncbi:alpha/beta fold hydrolase [Microbacterium ulmi]|uniref:alpha/beta fold hydrolase n=1 Tax=Microbacterium ulmi TaxID=179095 RepID=UPI0031330F99|nr:pimeloyl-ACP methyl ester carboxylesterase [Microbacterium ulmi]